MLQRYFGSMAGRLFLFLLIGVMGSASIALGMANVRRQADLRRIRLERLTERVQDYISLTTLERVHRPDVQFGQRRGGNYPGHFGSDQRGQGHAAAAARPPQACPEQREQQVPRGVDAAVGDLERRDGKQQHRRRQQPAQPDRVNVARAGVEDE